MPTFSEFTKSFSTLWEWISMAPSHQRHPMRTPTVITSYKNIPNARTMVLRDVLTHELIFFTDIRSPKVRDIESNPFTVIHCYDPKKKLQLRIRAEMEVCQEHPQTKRWRAIGLHRFHDYGSQLAPSSILEQGESPHATLEIAKENFCILRAKATDIELLKLSRNGHQRVEWKSQNSNWNLVKLVP